MNVFLRRIAGLCLIRMLLDMALPEGDCAAWAELGMELAVMLCILEGFVEIVELFYRTF